MLDKIGESVELARFLKDEYGILIVNEDDVLVRDLETLEKITNEKAKIEKREGLDFAGAAHVTKGGYYFNTYVTFDEMEKLKCR